LNEVNRFLDDFGKLAAPRNVEQWNPLFATIATNLRQGALNNLVIG
jgi:hypothetical protein